MKMRVVKKTIKDTTHAYYTPRSKKIFNLIKQIDSKKNTNFTLGGCLIYRDKNLIILEKELKKQ